MLGVLRAVEKVGDNAGSNVGLSAIVLALYGAVFVVALVAWITWAVRNRRGVVQWGEAPPGESFGEKVGRRWTTASAPPVPAAPPAATSELVEDEEPDERQRTAG